MYHLFRKENPDFSKADKRVYDYPAFTPEKYDNQSLVLSNATEKSVSSASAEKSITDNKTTSVQAKNPLYVPTSGTQAVNEETLNSD